MKVYFVGSADIDDSEIEENSLVLISHLNGLEIDLVSELDGNSDILKRLAIYSRAKNITCVAGIVARIYRRKYLSVVVIDKGKIIGISDATHDLNYNLGASYRVYKTSLGNLGILVGNDLFYPEATRTLSTHDSDVILALAGRISPVKCKMVQKSLSFVNGISIVSMAGNTAIITNQNGEIIHESDDEMSKCEFMPSRDYSFNDNLRRDIYDNVYIEE